MELFWNDAEEIVIRAYKGIEPTLIDDLLPPVLKGARKNREGVEDFFFRLHITLAAPGLMDKAKGATEAEPAKVKIPPLDLEHYHLLQGGQFQHDRFRDLIRPLAMRWRKPPPPGLVWKLIEHPDDVIKLSKTLDTIDAPNDQEKEMLDFINLMQPPNFGDGRAMTRAEADNITNFIFSWMMKIPPVMGQSVDSSLAIRDLNELGVRNIDGSLNRRRAKLAASFIWREDAGEPSFSALKRWLAEQDRKDVKTVQAKLNGLKKKKKVARKQAKLHRKKGRR